MKILRVANIPDNRTGGMSRVMYSTGDHLIKMGHHVDYLFSEQIEINIPNYLNRFTPLCIPSLIEKLKRQNQRYDIVEIHEAIAAPYCFMRQFNKDLPPVVVFSHGLEKRLQMAEFAYYTTKKLPISLSLRYFRLTVAQSIYAIHHADHVICLNSEDLCYLRGRGLSPNKISQHSNGVDSKFLIAGEDLSKDNIFRSGVLFLGSWIYRKGILDLVSAMSNLMQHHSLLKLTIAGCGCDEKAVLAYFPEHLRSRIRVIPKVSSNEELIEIYRQHEIFVLPSYYEGQPLVMLEAAAMGLAIVTTNICGMADFIEPEIDGLLVPAGNCQALEEAIEKLLQNQTLTKQIGENIREKVQKYTWEMSAMKIYEAYNKAAKNALAESL